MIGVEAYFFYFLREWSESMVFYLTDAIDPIQPSGPVNEFDLDREWRFKVGLNAGYFDADFDYRTVPIIGCN